MTVAAGTLDVSEPLGFAADDAGSVIPRGRELRDVRAAAACSRSIVRVESRCVACSSSCWASRSSCFRAARSSSDTVPPHVVPVPISVSGRAGETHRPICRPCSSARMIASSMIRSSTEEENRGVPTSVTTNRGVRGGEACGISRATVADGFLTRPMRRSSRPTGVPFRATNDESSDHPRNRHFKGVISVRWRGSLKGCSTTESSETGAGRSALHES